MSRAQFEWDDRKNQINLEKHGVSFYDAQNAFLDPFRVIAEDMDHSTPSETRYFCFGKVGDGILSIRFTY